jgi:NAD(P)-dependent dehydrogenase (short-subunit alcohol dehydrogenase family)
MQGLHGKTLIITGGSLGMGRELALELAGAGVNLVLNARHEPQLAEAADQCRAQGAQVRYVAGNAAAAETVSRLVKQALELGGFYGFVHVAGVLHPGPFLWELPESDFQEILESQVTAAYQLVRLAVPELLKQGEGLAVFFGSGAAVSNIAGIGAYCVAKAAEEHLARQLAEEAPQITTLIFRPGVTDTRMIQQALKAEGGAGESLRRRFERRREEGSIGSPQEEARALARLLLDNPRRYHGQITRK